MIKRTIEQLGPTVIFHCAAQGVSNPFLPADEVIRANVYGTIDVVRATKGRARIIVLQTPGEIDAPNVYAASKAAAWQCCRMYRRTEGWPITGAMLFQVSGPGQSPKNVIPAAIEAALANRDCPLTSGRPLIGVLPDRPGGGEAQCADAETTRSLLKWEAHVSLRDGLQGTINWKKHERTA